MLCQHCWRTALYHAMPAVSASECGKTLGQRCGGDADGGVADAVQQHQGVGVDECAAGVDERAAKDGRSGPAIPLMDVLLSTMLTHADRRWCGISRLY